MGIPNPEEYTITPHATERIKQRFGQTKDTLGDWANRLLKECVFVKREESGRDRYRYQDIAIILDVKKTASDHNVSRPTRCDQAREKAT